MLLRIASDLHLEAFSGRDAEALAVDFLPADDRDNEAVLVLAGDISSIPSQLVHFLDVCLNRFPHVIFIPGNHEMYRHNMDAWVLDMDERLAVLADKHRANKRNLYFSTGDIQQSEIGDVRFVYGTMWGDGGPTEKDKATVGFYLNDFRLITRGTGAMRFTVEDMITEHRCAKISLHAHLKQPWEGKTIVVTHHLPSRRLVSERFLAKDGSDGANGGFVGASEDILAYDHAPDVWIHGHTHCKIDTMLWKTRIVCNPTGYRGEWQLDDVGGQPTFIEL